MRKILLFVCALIVYSNVYGGVETAVLNERDFSALIKQAPSPSILSDEEHSDFSPPRQAEHLGPDSTDEEKSSSDEDSRENSDKENISSDEDHIPPVFHNLSPPKLSGILESRVGEAPVLSKETEEEQEMLKFLKRNLHEQEFLLFSNSLKIMRSPDAKENRFYACAKRTVENLYDSATLRSLEAMSNFALKEGESSSCIVQ
ncbi:hypothetical protein [Candidatus Finniella inopinata]|uniref:Uncharacterized protein n=1 Tax=Candidatus Finniella inopinata TaxID=1696036 RepID=A0A4Q7DHA8_9PROT|nr:hypothetical protein [Candidatus Finniella inopinata]RZI46092.1 hypothetical protein EQU50_03940 [Candidatus Finniella inopinata]